MKAVVLVGPWTLINVPLSCVEGEGHNFEEEAVEKKRALSWVKWEENVNLVKCRKRAN